MILSYDDKVIIKYISHPEFGWNKHTVKFFLKNSKRPEALPEKYLLVKISREIKFHNQLRSLNPSTGNNQ